MLDNAAYTPPSSGSPRPLHSARSIPTSSRSEKRMSRQITGYDLSSAYSGTKSPSRPSSPMVDQENRGLRAQRYPGMNSPKDTSKKDFASSYTSLPLGASASAVNVASRYQTQRTTPTETPLTARFTHHVRASPSFDSATNSALCRIEWRDIRTARPLHSVIEEARTLEIGTAERRSRLLIATGRSRRLAVENHQPELKELQGS